MMRTPAVAAAGGHPSLAPADATTNLYTLAEPPTRRARVRAARVFAQFLLELPRTGWLLIDIGVLCIALRAAYRFFVVGEPQLVPHVAAWQATAIFAATLTFSSLVFGLYERETLLSRSRILVRTLLTSSATVVLAYAVVYVVMYSTVSRRATALAMGTYVALGIAVRLLACSEIHKTKRRVVIVGPPRMIASYRRAVREGHLTEYRLMGYVHEQPPDDRTASPVPYLGTPAQLGDICMDREVTDIVVGSEATRNARVVNWMLPCLRRGWRVTNEPVFYEKTTGQIMVDQITPDWFLFADLKVHCDEWATLKRTVDLAGALLAVVLTAPLLPILALLIKLGDGEPVFYTQNRVGQHGKVFRLFKFRTMRVDAENGRSVWASPNDARVTRVGRLLRRTRLDELPQLYNILLGQMSIVGPRPERPEFVAELSRTLPYYNERHLVKPGLTGWAQIGYHYGSSVADARKKLQFDLYYLKHVSLELDLIILFRTLGTFLRGAC